MTFLRPRGNPEAGTRWHDVAPQPVIVLSETETEWVARPFMNPQCPPLTYPKYAWEAVEV